MTMNEDLFYEPPELQEPIVSAAKSTMDTIMESSPIYEEDADGSLVLTTLSAQFANDLAIGLSTPAELCKQYHVTPEQWDTLRSNDLFVTMVREAMETYVGDTNAAARRRHKAQVLLEDSIPRLYHIAHNMDHPGATQVAAIKLMAELAKDVNEESHGEKFSVTINIPDPNGVTERPAVQVSGEVIEQDK